MQPFTLRCNGSAVSQQQAQFAFGAPPDRRGLAARRGCNIVCMAHPRRVAKVAKQIEREVGQLLISDKTLQAAVCPERRRGFDGALSALASVTEVQISNDLQVAKVYLSIYSDDMGKAAAMEGLQRLEGYVRKHIGKQIRLRLTPEIRFVRDDSIERSERIFKLLDQIKKIDRGEAEPPPLAFHGDLEEEEEGREDSEAEPESVFETEDLGMFAHGHKEGKGGSMRQQQATVQQQQRQPQPQRQRQGQQDSKGGGVQNVEEMAAMLAAFKEQAEQRGWGQK